MPASRPPIPGIFATIVKVFRQNRLPCLVLNGTAVALVATYYRSPAMAELWNAVGAFKTRWSCVFSPVSTVFAAAILPFCIQAAMGTLPPHRRLHRLGLLALFWGYRGLEIDLFYRFQGLLFGHGKDLATLAAKVALDQFLVSPLWFVPTYLVALRWIDQGGAWSRMRSSLNRAFWTRTFPTVLITNWIVWIPVLVLVYSLPAPLQFPLFSVVMCFFILVVTLLAKANPEESSG
jgi:hypothetical protein